jgi:Fringe-like
MQLQPSLRRLFSSRSRTWILVIAPMLSLGFLWSWLHRPDSLLLQQFLITDSHSLPLEASGDDRPPSSGGTAGMNNHNHYHNHNPKIPGMDDILVVLKTGVTEALSRVPVQIETTFSSVPNFAIFSDYKETIAGVETHDVLSRINEQVKRNIPEFELYNRIRAQGRKALTEEDYGDDSNGPFGRQNNPGWKLDKWKFLPMIPAALELKPNAKWFVFMEADSYFLWPNLAAWLSQLDHQRDWYLGFPMAIGDVVFAYGGSGFVISNPVMHKVSGYLANNSKELDEFTASQWAGDCVLGKVFADAGVGLNWSWPTLQNDKPWELDHFANIYDRRAWCYPLVSYHHMQPDDIREMWEFDKEWFKLVCLLSFSRLTPNFLHC